MSRVAELIAVQPFMRLEDYATEDAFRAKISALMAKVDDARERRADGAFAHPGLVVFPENIGTFLGIVGHYDLARTAKTTDEAIGRVVLRHVPALLRTMVAQRVWNPKHAVLVMLSRVTWPIYFRAFRDAAIGHGATVVAGSIVAARNRLGSGSARFEPLDGRFYNLSLTFDPAGRVVNETRKVNLVPTLEDVLGITPGLPEDLRPFETEVGRVGTLICYDGFHEAHTHEEPGFRALGAHYDRLGVRILAQPAANPWPWAEKWVFADPGEDLLRKDQWITEGLCTQLRDLPHVRYAVNPHLLGQLLDNRFDGRSFIFERLPSGEVRTLAQAKHYELDPKSEEILCARVEI